MNRTVSKRAVILAPHGRDAVVAQNMLREGGFEAEYVRDVPGLVSALRNGAGFAVVTEEALLATDLRELSVFLTQQATWSDFPFIVLTARGGGLERNPGAVRLLEVLGNVTFLERPFHPTTLVSLARASLRGRLRQYEARLRLEEIREGQDRLNVALDAGGLGSWMMDLHSHKLQASDICKRHYGYSSGSTFSYQDLLENVHADDRDRMQAAVRQSVDQGEPYDIEYRVRWSDGSIHWVHVSGQIERDRRGEAVRMVGVSRDITARHLRDARRGALLALGDGLRQVTTPSEMSYLAAEILGKTLEVSRAGYGVIDPVQETITIERDWNSPGTSSLAGILNFRDYGSYIEDLKRGVLVAIADARNDLRTQENAEALEALDARAVLNMPVVEEKNFIALLYLNHKYARDWTDDELMFVREIADRTQAAIERRRAEGALAMLAESLERQVEERTRERDRTWQKSQDLLAVVGADGKFIAVNPAWTAVLGWTAAEVVGLDHRLFSHPDDRDASEGALIRAQTGALPQYENRVRHKDGSYRWVSWVASSDDDQVYASGRHITAEKEAQEQLGAAQEQLRQAQKMEAVGQLTGGLAHDFNNMLAGIMGGLELVKMRISQGRAGEIDKYVDMAQVATKRAAALTHRLLAFSRRQTLDPKPTDVNRLIAGMEDFLRRTVGPEIELEVVGAGGLWAALIDPHQLENALLNLCINARDAMPDGGRITIESANKWLDARSARERDLPPGQYLSICVTDTGTGMSPETVERAFDPFYTTKPLGEGTGLGLSMIYGFARQSGGQVRIYSELGQGTTMCLYFPRLHADNVRLEQEEESLEPLSQAAGETVLVVDDEPAIRALVADVLVELGYDIIEAADGVEGLAILQKQGRIDLLITDVGLPKGMNGRQLADAARISRPDLKVLFITGYAENAVIGNSQLEPGMHVVTKPFALDALANRVRELITSTA